MIAFGRTTYSDGRVKAGPDRSRAVPPETSRPVTPPHAAPDRADDRADDRAHPGARLGPVLGPTREGGRGGHRVALRGGRGVPRDELHAAPALLIQPAPLVGGERHPVVPAW